MNKPIAEREFIALAAMMISMVALTIDAMLPALPAIAADFQLQVANDQQSIITWIFLGLAIGQLIYGPLSDAIGRKPSIMLGLGIFLIGSTICLLTEDYQWMLGGRILQGLGAASPRIVTMALIRDRFEGIAMAHIMSFIMAIFILVPAIAPLLGQSILLLGSWHDIFALFIVFALIIMVWFGIRQAETLPKDRRRRLSLPKIQQGLMFIAQQRNSVGAILVLGCIFGSFVGYLSSAQQIFVDHYATGKAFPFFFALQALMVGLASLLSGRLVFRWGIITLCRNAALIQVALSIAAWIAGTLWHAGQPPLWLFLGYSIPLFFCLGLQFGNLNALAMNPLGKLAGLGASVASAVPTLLAVPLGAWIGQSYDGTPMPMMLGFALCSSAASALLFFWIQQETLHADGGLRQKMQ